jgi:hypothetical protein
MDLEQTRPDRAGAKAPLTLKRLNVLSIVERTARIAE